MLECRPPSAAFSAGAMTSANRIGVSIGTAIWRGLCAVSAARRAARVRSAWGKGVRRRRRGTATGAAVVVAMGTSVSGGGGEGLAGQPQVDVVERGAAGRERSRAQSGVVQRGDGVAGARAVQQDGQRLAGDVGL